MTILEARNIEGASFGDSAGPASVYAAMPKVFPDAAFAIRRRIRSYKGERLQKFLDLLALPAARK